MDVKLKKGGMEPEMLVKTLMAILKELFEAQPFFFSELVRKCRNEEYELSSDDVRVKLHNLNLLDHYGMPYKAVRNIVLSAVTGEDHDMLLGDPIKEQ